MRGGNKFAAGDLWAAIDKVAAQAGMNLAELAKKAGLPQNSLTAEGRSRKDGQPVWPSLPTITAIITVAGISLREFGKLVDAAQQGRDVGSSSWNDDQEGRNRASG